MVVQLENSRVFFIWKKSWIFSLTEIWWKHYWTIFWLITHCIDDSSISLCFRILIEIYHSVWTSWSWQSGINSSNFFRSSLFSAKSSLAILLALANSSERFWITLSLVTCTFLIKFRTFDLFPLNSQSGSTRLREFLIQSLRWIIFRAILTKVSPRKK